jgi:hypothetical protein
MEKPTLIDLDTWRPRKKVAPTVTAKPRLIALYSPVMQSGKSTVADYLVSKHGFKRVAFADTLKQMARVFLSKYTTSNDELDRMLTGDLKEVVIPALGYSPRHVMQTLGTEWGRNALYADVWVDSALQVAKIQMEVLGHSVVIDDMRFPNEHEAVKRIGSAWMVIRPDAPKNETKHPSEGLLDYAEFDRVLINGGTIEELYRQIDAEVGA